MAYDRLYAALDRALRSKRAWNTRRGKDKAADSGTSGFSTSNEAAKREVTDPRAERLHIALDRVLDTSEARRGK